MTTRTRSDRHVGLEPGSLEAVVKFEMRLTNESTQIGMTRDSQSAPAMRLVAVADGSARAQHHDHDYYVTSISRQPSRSTRLQRDREAPTGLRVASGRAAGPGPVAGGQRSLAALARVTVTQ